MKPEWRPFLELRSVKDKIGVAIDCDVAEPGDLNIISELVREGIIVWIDRTVLSHLAIVNKQTGTLERLWVNADVYQLTLKGIALCNAHGIRQR
jgi:hypothetical protein